MHQRLAASVAILVATAGVAAADEQRGFVEGVIGVGIPLGEEEGYEEFVDPGLKAGVRAGASNGVEIAADYTDLGEYSVLGTDISFARYRAMAGFRHRIPAGKSGKSTLFFRGAAGVDVAQVHAVNETFGIENDETDVGVAAELGFGVHAAFGNAFVGAHVAVPFAFHFDDDDPDDNEDFDLEYTSYDLDLLFTVGVNL